MNIALWIAQAILAIAFLGAGGMKVAKSRTELADAGMGYVEDFSDGAIKAIGGAEVLGAIGVVLPALVDTATVLVPVAATGLAITMVGAFVTHARRDEYPKVVPNIVLGGLAAFVAWGRFGDWAFGG